jgi:hypothetical protein
MGSRFRLQGFLIVLGATAIATAAEHPPVVLSWSGPDACPTGERVLSRLEQLLLRSEPVSNPLVVDADVTVDAEGFRLELATRHGKEEFQRTIQAPSCADLADAAAVILALLIDPKQRAVSSEKPSPPRSPTPVGGFGSASRPRTGSDTERTIDRRWGPLVAGSFDFGSLPTPALGLELGGSVAVERVRLSLTGIWFPNSDIRVLEASGTEPAKGGSFTLLSGHLRLCYELFGRTLLAGCAEAELGALGAQGFGTAADTERRVLWAAVGPGLEAGLPLSRQLLFRVGVSALMGLSRPEFVLSNVGRVYRPQMVSGRLGAGLLLYFP